MNEDKLLSLLADDAAKVINHRIKILAEKNERFLRENATPPIKGKITKFKLWWRGIDYFLMDSDNNPAAIIVNRWGLIIYKLTKIKQKYEEV